MLLAAAAAAVGIACGTLAGPVVGALVLLSVGSYTQYSLPHCACPTGPS